MNYVIFFVTFTAEPVSFSARMIENKLPLRSNERLIFKEVSNNVMNGYNTKTGVFSAPVSGVYLFIYFIEVSEAYSEVQLVVGGKVVSSTRAYGGAEINIGVSGFSNRITFSENGRAVSKSLQCVTGRYSVSGSGNSINIQPDKYCMQGDFSGGVGSNSVLANVSKNEQVWLQTSNKNLAVHFKPFGTAFTGVLLYEHYED